MKTKIISLMLVLSCAGASAATALPNSSGDLRALEENRADGDKTAVLTKEETNTDVSGSRKFYLQNFVFTSEDAIQQDVLAALVESYCGREVDFNELQQAVNKLTAYLRGQGYAVATAFLPQQEITDGIIEVKIVLGRLSYVQVNNTSALAEGQAEKAAGILQKGELLRTDRLETVLNNINDLAGVTAVGVLRAGQANGTSDFVIDLRADKPQQTILYTDNYGNKYSGRYRYGFQTTINNPGRIGDKFFLGGMLSNDNLHNYNLGYEMPVGSRGTKLGVSYSLMDYTLSGFYNILDAVGRAKTFSIYGSTPLINTASEHLAAVYGYDNRQLKDELRTFGIDTKKHSNALYAGIEGNIKGGVMHLKRDYESTGNIIKTLVCYNAGCGRLKNNEWRKIRETTNYITKINEVYPEIKGLYYANTKSRDNKIAININDMDFEEEAEEIPKQITKQAKFQQNKIAFKRNIVETSERGTDEKN